MKIDDRKIVIDHIIDAEFMPALIAKLHPFIEEIKAKHLYTVDYARTIGLPIRATETVLDIKPDLERLSSRLCQVFSNPK